MSPLKPLPSSFSRAFPDPPSLFYFHFLHTNQNQTLSFPSSPLLFHLFHFKIFIQPQHTRFHFTLLFYLYFNISSIFKVNFYFSQPQIKKLILMSEGSIQI
ncbi:uncharacterized protein DS421_1g27120 [Arachis hypogaea]|nr:uncharacterized protein DS421_1g27120 [Arachis hypogaea]